MLVDVSDAIASPDGQTNHGPLAGVLIIEIGRFAAAPSSATVLSDWGADVIKVEPPGGDPARGPGSISDSGARRVNPRFDVHNRSRRSIVLDLTTPKGQEVADKLLAAADVLVTNLSPGALVRLGLDAPVLRARHPGLIVAQISGYDLSTQKAADRSYDHGAYWSYSGVAALFAGANGEPPQPAGGFGDRAAGSMLAGAIAAALYSRDRTGHGMTVRTSLVNTALWLMASDVSDIVTSGHLHRVPDRRHTPLPTVNCFRTADARWLWLQLMIPESGWQKLLAALDAAWLDEDPRFRGGDVAKLRANSGPFTELLDEILRSRTLAEWASRLSEHDIVWAPVRTLEEAVNDADVRNSSAFIEVEDRNGARHVSVNTPCSFDGPVRQPTQAPQAGQDTDEILASLGLSPAEISELRLAGVLGDAGELTARGPAMTN